MVSQLDPGSVSNLCSFVGENPEAAPESLREAVKTFNMDVKDAKDEDKLVAALLSMYLTRNLVSSGFIRLVSKLEIQ